MRTASNIRVLALLAMAITGLHVQAAEQWPAMTGETARPECVSAFELARSMFRSTATRVYAPLVVPDSMGSRLVLGAAKVDISGGSEINADAELFEQIPRMEEEYSRRSVYWEIRAGAKSRIAVAEFSLGWRGDVYGLYLVDSGIDKAEFMRSIRWEESPSPFQSLFSGWRPPLVFLLKDGGPLWFIDVYGDSEPLGPWNVYAAVNGKYEQVCVLSFKPSSQTVSQLLPRRVQVLTRMLDETIGPGRNEGSLQPTARLRQDIQRVLANMVQRPWAMRDADTYNSREEVEAGLREWANGAARRNLHQSILKAYPLAEQALSSYYARQYGLSSARAEIMAKWALDIVLRAHYAFPNGGQYFRYDNVNTNPWPTLKP